MKKNTFLETTTAIAFFTLMGIFLYYSFYPFRVTTLNSIGIDKAEYCRGEWVKVSMDFQKHMNIKADIKWYIVDGIVYQLDSPGISRPEGQNIVTVSKKVPHSILPGAYNMRIEMEYSVHPLRSNIFYSWDTPKFTVKEDSECSKVDELELGEPEPEVEPSPALPLLYPAYAEETNQSQEQTIVVPEINDEPVGEPQMSQEPSKEPEENGLIQEIVESVKKLLP